MSGDKCRGRRGQEHRDAADVHRLAQAAQRGGLDALARALWEDEKRAAERIQATPLRRLGEPRDIGGIAVFLASDAAAFVTGQCIVADGGVTIL